MAEQHIRTPRENETLVCYHGHDLSWYLEELKEKYEYHRQRRKTRNVLDTVFAEMVEIQEIQNGEILEMLAGEEIQKIMMPLETGITTDNRRARLSSSNSSDGFYSFSAWFESADAVGGDIFMFYDIDEVTKVLIKGDVSGHGVTASLVATVVHSVCQDYFRMIRDIRKNGSNTSDLIDEIPIDPTTLDPIPVDRTGLGDINFEILNYRINDLLNEYNFEGRFFAHQMVETNTRTGKFRFNHAGDDGFWVWDSKAARLLRKNAVQSPAIGQIESSMIQMSNDRKNDPWSNTQSDLMYQDQTFQMSPNDILFLMTDGFEESHRLFRNRDGKIITFQELPEGVINRAMSEQTPWYFLFTSEKPDEVLQACRENGDWVELVKQTPIPEGFSYTSLYNSEEFGIERIRDIITSVLTGSSYELTFTYDPLITQPLMFDFSTLEPTPENAVLAVTAVEKVFRLVPSPQAGRNDLVRIEKKLDTFMQDHFVDFDVYYRTRLPENGADARYAYYSHLREDEQDDDLTLLAFQRNSFNEPPTEPVVDNPVHVFQEMVPVEVEDVEDQDEVEVLEELSGIDEEADEILVVDYID